MIEFVSYDGHFPNLCIGTLNLKLNGEQKSLTDVLSSGGICRYHEDNSVEREYGEWSIIQDKLPDWAKPYQREILDLVNKNVPHGCCGGCLQFFEYKSRST